MKLYIFNPEHDLAIANGNENFQAPESALLFASDLSLLPAWFADESSLILSDQKFNPDVIPHGLNVQSIAPYSDMVPSHCAVEPWGWDASIRKQIIASGVNSTSTPDLNKLDIYRSLSHRRTASFAMEYLRSNLSEPNILPQPAIELKTPTEVARFASAHKEIVLKSPWSGSGKGVFWSKGPLTQSLSGWCQRIIDKQGCVMGEIAMERIQDFAMEYRTKDKKTYFAGYSLFITEGSGIYRGNRLMSNSAIEKELQRWIDVKHLHWIQQKLQDFIAERIAPHYDGYVGVDMFIYRENGNIRINPAVEINLRMTMGMVARIIYDKYIHTDSNGWFFIDHEPPGQLLSDHEYRTISEPMQLKDGKLSNGYMSLCPIEANTVYRASIRLTTN